MQMEAAGELGLSTEPAMVQDLYGLNDPATAANGHWPGGWSNAACGSCRSSPRPGTIPGTTTATSTTGCATLPAGDLKQLGLLDSTIVLRVGEFGRMPISKDGNGRDHNPHGFLALLAGGFKAGPTDGATDEFGYPAVKDRVSVPDLMATILHPVGLDYDLAEFPQPRGGRNADRAADHGGQGRHGGARIKKPCTATNRSHNTMNKLWSCLLPFLALLSTGAAQEQAAPVAASVTRPMHPILIRNEHGPLLRLVLEVPKGQSLQAKSLEFSFAGTDDVNDLAKVQLFSTGAKEGFSSASPLGEPLAPAASIRVQVNRPLVEGRNVFWLSGQLKPTADLQHHIVACCTKVVTSAGAFTPHDDVGNARQRIGVALRRQHEDGVHTYRIPALTTSVKGTLLAVYDMRRRAGRDLQEDIDIGLSRSTDGGRTWEAPRVIMDMGQFGKLPPEQNGCSDPGILVDQKTGEIFCFAVWMHGKPGKHQWNDDGSEPGFEIGKAAQFMMVRSKDDGRTWSAPENLTRKLKQEAWWLLAPAPQAGICLPDGTLVMPVQGRTGRARLETFATIMVSRDHGQSWTVGNFGYTGGNECQAALLGDGSIMLNVRNDREHYRAVVVTKDLGKTWQAHPTSRNTLIEPNCNGSLLRFDYEQAGKKKHVLLFANPHSQKSRTHHTLQVSFDDGRTWPDSHHWLLDVGRGAGYPSLTRVDREHVGIVYEGSQAHLVFEKLALIDILEPTRRHASREVWQRRASPEGAQFLERRRQTPPFGATRFDLTGLRMGMGTRQEPNVPGTKLEKVKVAGVPCEWVMTPGADPDVRLLYLHGGGWVSGSGGNYLPLAAEISRAARCAVLLPDYRLAPEHPFPAGLDDCVAAYRWMLANGPNAPGAAKATFVAGDSAGGNLTLATLLALKDRKLPMPLGGIPISPATDFTLSSAALTLVDDPIISARTMPEFRNRYLAKTDHRHPLASPLFGDFRGLPPLLIQLGEHEMLRDDAIRVAKKARADGVRVTLEIWPGMVHVFQIRGLPESREAIKRIGEFVRSQREAQMKAVSAPTKGQRSR
ncbi:MAG: alpha/beta hydrolase fold domain-containing protein [Gemmataceae bacterium]